MTRRLFVRLQRVRLLSLVQKFLGQLINCGKICLGENMVNSIIVGSGATASILSYFYPRAKIISSNAIANFLRKKIQ